MKKKAALIVLLMMILLPVFSGTDGQGLPGEHLDEVSSHEAKFTVQAYKKDKAGSPTSSKNSLVLQVFDQISFREGALGEIKANARPTTATSAIAPTNIDPYLAEFFGDGVTVAVISIQGYVAPGKLPLNNPGQYVMNNNNQNVTIDVAPYSPTKLSTEGKIETVSPSVSAELVNMERNTVIPYSLELIETNLFTTDVPNMKPVTLAGQTEISSTKFSHYYWAGRNKKKNAHDDSDFYAKVNLDTQNASLSLDLENHSSFYGSYWQNDSGESGPDQWGNEQYRFRRAIEWEYSVGIRIKSGISKADFDALPSGRYTTVLNIVVKAE